MININHEYTNKINKKKTKQDLAIRIVYVLHELYVQRISGNYQRKIEQFAQVNKKKPVKVISSHWWWWRGGGGGGGGGGECGGGGGGGGGGGLGVCSGDCPQQSISICSKRFHAMTSSWLDQKMQELDV